MVSERERAVTHANSNMCHWVQPRDKVVVVDAVLYSYVRHD